MIITNSKAYQVFALHSALKLELIGLKSNKGSAYKTLKEMFNLKGNKQKVYDQVQEIKTTLI